VAAPHPGGTSLCAKDATAGKCVHRLLAKSGLAKSGCRVHRSGMRWSIRKLAPFALIGTAACADRVPGPETGEGADSIRAVAPADFSGLRLEAEVAVVDSVPAQLRGSLEVTNPTDQATSFDVGGCPIFLRVYDSTGTKVWDQGDGAICTMILRTVTLGPRETERFQTAEADAAEILGENLASGTYRAAVYLALVDGGQPEASASEVELAR
jgi:hypothetical protein